MSDPVERRSFELDVVALGTATGDGKRVVLAIGEAKASAAQLAPTDLERRERLRSRLGARADVGRTNLLLFGRAGFERALVRAVKGRPDVELVDLERLYEGDWPTGHCELRILPYAAGRSQVGAGRTVPSDRRAAGTTEPSAANAL